MPDVALKRGLGLAVALCACLLCAWPAAAQRVPLQEHGTAKQPGYHERKPNAESEPASGGAEQREESAPYRADCGNPVDHDAADFCQQKRSADAAEATLIATREQNLMLIWTLVLTGIASVAAAISARASQRTLTGLDRPHLFFHTKENGLASIPTKPRDGKPENMVTDPTKFYFKNVGRAAAVMRRMYAARIPHDVFAQRSELLRITPSLALDIDLPHGAPITADGGTSVTFEAVDFGLSESDRAPSHVRWFLVGFVVYSDPMKSAQYLTGFAAEYDLIRQRWNLADMGQYNRRYNYSRQLRWPERADAALRSWARRRRNRAGLHKSNAQTGQGVTPP